MKITTKHNFKFEKKFGQNFLSDTNLLKSIVNDSNVCKFDEVLEIGTGAGTLTKQICEKAKKVISYEIDKNLKPLIDDNLSDVENVSVIYEDALKKDISQIEKDFVEKYKIIANIPYYITTPLIFKFLENTTRVISMTLMVQKEVAERIVATPKSDNYGVLSIMISYYGNAKILRNVSRKMFTPIPNVDSAIIKIDISPNCDISFAKSLKMVVDCAFASRRKTLTNNLCNTFKIDKLLISEILEKSDLPQTVRGENLSLDNFIKLTNVLLTKSII